jgi:FkbM family methyltransferase
MDELTRNRVARPGLLTEFIREGSLVFDIGANIGRMTYQYLARGASRVVAVEPQSVCVNEELVPRFGNDERVTIVHKACGAEEGEATITTYGHGSTISTFVPDYYWGSGGPWANTPHDGSETVQMTTLDALIEIYGVPDFIKVDVEGYEYEVLQGLHQLVPLSFEFHPWFGPRAKQCMGRVLEIEPDAEFNHTAGEALTYASPEWLDSEQMGAAIDALLAQHGKDYFGNIYCRKREA